MIKGLESVIIGSAKAKKLANFYKEKIGLKCTMEMENPDTGEAGYAFEFKEGAGLYIMDHSEVKGANKNPQQVFFNLEVDDIEKEAKRLKTAHVKNIAKIYHMEGYGLIATWQDPEGNYFQTVQVRASK